MAVMCTGSLNCFSHLVAPPSICFLRNADDNSYEEGVVPTAQFLLRHIGEVGLLPLHVFLAEGHLPLQ